MKVVIFDSGIGGFSILRELSAYAHAYLYLADQAFFPYGDKSADELIERLMLIGNWLSQQKPDLVVIACNTATVTGIHNIRKLLSCPVVGVEPVVKPATKYPKSLIIGTHTTLISTRMQALLSDYPGQITTYYPRGLAQAIEEINLDQVKKYLHEINKLVQRENINALGLSCTHYPLIKDLLKKDMPLLTVLDPSKAVANHIISFLSKGTLSKTPSYSFYTTGEVLRFNYQIKHYLDFNISSQKAMI